MNYANTLYGFYRSVGNLFVLYGSTSFSFPYLWAGFFITHSIHCGKRRNRIIIPAIIYNHFFLPLLPPPPSLISLYQAMIKVVFFDGNEFCTKRAFLLSQETL